MTWELFVTLVSVCGAVVAVISSLRGAGRAARAQEAQDAAALTEMRVDIRYIKQRVDGFDAVRDIATMARSAADAANERLDRHLKYDHQKDSDLRQKNELV